MQHPTTSSKRHLDPMTGDLRNHFHSCQNVKKPLFGNFWALGPIAFDSSHNFRSNGLNPIKFHELSCDFWAKTECADRLRIIFNFVKIYTTPDDLMKATS